MSIKWDLVWEAIQKPYTLTSIQLLALNFSVLHFSWVCVLSAVTITKGLGNNEILKLNYTTNYVTSACAERFYMKIMILISFNRSFLLQSCKDRMHFQRFSPDQLTMFMCDIYSKVMP